MRIKIYVNSDKLRVIIAKKNMTQRDFVKRVGITDEHFSHILLQRKCPSPHTRKRIQKILCASWDDLFTIRQMTGTSKEI